VLSIWVFGVHPWSTMLPQVVEGMITALAAYVVGARWKGSATGLLAAATTATTPSLSAMFGRSSEDALITMALACALWCWQSAILSGLPPLLGSCPWVAVGFQANMLQARFIIPALGISTRGAQPLAAAAARRCAGRCAHRRPVAGVDHGDHDDSGARPALPPTPTATRWCSATTGSTGSSPT
jgi:Dolichyl-phosphate-mannose-protein mannosyltransferase